MFQNLKDFLNHGGVTKVALGAVPILGYLATVLPAHTVGHQVALILAGAFTALFASANPAKPQI